ncbi:hypothetical protein TRVA0_004S03906 [Trichomonascus vanleenenianus]|uniref:uncharacterized protein n=1 Tax=Trichomonascus vanleenenianus TaxID=2268995 RepID=UPI003ECB8C93
MKTRKELQEALKSLLKLTVPYGADKTTFKRTLKGALTTLICFVLCLINPVDRAMGTSSFLVAMIAVNVHPARRLGAMIEAMVLSLTGAGTGVAFLVLIHFIASKINLNAGETQALGFLAVIEILVLFVHGFVRSLAPRLFLLVFLFFLVVHFGFLTSLTIPPGVLAKTFAIPITIAIGVSTVVSLFVFPEFGSTYLGTSVIKMLNGMHEHFNTSVLFFLGKVDTEVEPAKGPIISLGTLQEQKSRDRNNLITCKSVMEESAFEISYSFMSPLELKPMVKTLKNAVVSSNALTGACELEYALLGYSHLERDGGRRKSDNSTGSEESGESDDAPHHHHATRSESMSPDELIEALKPHKEIEHGDKDLLLQFLDSVRDPILTLSNAISLSLNAIKRSIAYAYDVPEDEIELLTFAGSKSTLADRTPAALNNVDITMEVIDRTLQKMARALSDYDEWVPKSLESIVLEGESENLDEELLMPRDEFFLISSFLMNLREFANSTNQILVECRDILEICHRRQAKGWYGRGLWFSGLSSRKLFLKYLATGEAEKKEADVQSTSKRYYKDEDPQKSSEPIEPSEKETEKEEPSVRKDIGRMFRILAAAKWKRFSTSARNIIADIVEFPNRYKKHVRYAFNFTLLLMLISFPAFSPNMRQWYIDIRGAWCGFVAAISLESSIGSTNTLFLSRSVGVILGSAWGYATYVAGSWGADPYVMTVMLAIGVLPAYYLLLRSPFPKAATVAIVSCNIVILSTVRPTIPGTILTNFAKRCITMLVGSSAAILVQISIYPVKARVEMVKSVAFAIQCCARLEGALSQGIDLAEYPSPDLHLIVDQRCNKLFQRAKKALVAAEVYREATEREPRLKGSFSSREKIYGEIIFVLHQIVDKFQNIAFMRKKYGSAVIEDLGPYVYIYRREFYGCLTSTLRALEQALLTKSSLPQFLPSSRVAHLRVVNRVREMLAGETSRFTSQVQSRNNSRHPSMTDIRIEEPSNLHPLIPTDDHRHNMVKHKYMSWSANSAGLEEIVEYVEELIELTKLIVGVNEFRFGFLSRPLYEDWAAGASHDDNLQPGSNTRTTTNSDMEGNDSKLQHTGQRSFSMFGEPNRPNLELGIRPMVSQSLPQIGEKGELDRVPSASSSVSYTDRARIIDQELPIALQRFTSRRQNDSKRKKKQIGKGKQ